MKIKSFILSLFVSALLSVNPVKAKTEKREVASFSEISLKIAGTLYLEQGSVQGIKIEAEEATLKEIITEVKDRRLIIRFPAQSYFQRKDPGEIIIRITVPEVDGLSVSGAGDIIAKETIKTRILDMNVSGSGNIKLENLDADRVLNTISGSGNIMINDGGPSSELTAAISGSGNLKASGFEAKNIEVKIAGSGNCWVNSNGQIKAKIAGSGNVFYSGNPSVESTIAGSGNVREAR